MGHPVHPLAQPSFLGSGAIFAFAVENRGEWTEWKAENESAMTSEKGCNCSNEYSSDECSLSCSAALSMSELNLLCMSATAQ